MSADEPTESEVIETVRRAEASGDYLLACDEAIRGIELFPASRPLKYLAVRAMARAGSPTQAETLYRQYELGDSDDVDIASLEARIAKDRYLLSPGDGSAAAQSAEIYRRVFERTGRSFPAINAATMSLLSGDAAEATRLAREVLAICATEAPTEPEDRYWHQATVAEAALLLEDTEQAREALARAAAIEGERYASIASTYRQLRLICDLKGIDRELLAPLKRPAVMFFSGHMIAAPGGRGRFAAESEGPVARRIHDALAERDVRFGYGSLASGADILFAEALLARGAELHVVLPFEIEEFKAVSVAPAGADWTARFDTCLAAATSVTYATRGAYLGDDILFAYAARIAMGLARIRADGLETEPCMIAVWDGGSAGGDAGTAVDVAYWRDRGLATDIIDCGRPATGKPAAASQAKRDPSLPKRAILPVLFGDVKGFSGLQEQHLPAFNMRIMGALGETIAGHGDDVLFTNTWGDAVHVVFANVVAAAHCALEMQDVLRTFDVAALDLPSEIGMRISLHVGPVFVGYDYINREETYYGRTLTRAARMEPVTPVGQVFVTEQFAALIEMEIGDHIRCDYVGCVPLAKDFGELRMYRLTARTEIPASGAA